MERHLVENCPPSESMDNTERNSNRGDAQKLVLGSQLYRWPRLSRDVGQDDALQRGLSQPQPVCDSVKVAKSSS